MLVVVSTLSTSTSALYVKCVRDAGSVSSFDFDVVVCLSLMFDVVVALHICPSARASYRPNRESRGERREENSASKINITGSSRRRSVHEIVSGT